MNTFDEYSNTELFHGYEADFSVKLLIIKVDTETLYRGVYAQDEYIEIKKDYYGEEYSFLEDGSKNSINKPWIMGGISVTESENGITEVSFKIIDPGVPTSNGDIEFPWLYPGICTRIKGIFSLRYLNDFPDVGVKEYRGFLKEMKPSFPKNAYPNAEYVFQCSGFEMTRTVRTFAYPSLGVAKSSTEVEITNLAAKTNPEYSKTFDRSWATKAADDPEPYLSNKDILREILGSYKYPVEYRGTIPEIYFCLDNRIEEVKTKLGTDRVLPSIKAEPITDWLLLKDILSKTGSSLVFEARTVKKDETTTDKSGKIIPKKVGDVETRAVIENKSNSNGDITSLRVQFYFNRMNNGIKIPYNPLITKNFVMLDEPSITISGNWQASAVMEEQDIITETDTVDPSDPTKTIAKGTKVGTKMVLTDIDENGDPILYELDMRKLDTPEAEATFNQLIKGNNFNFETVKQFFIANTGAPKYPEGGNTYKVYQFHGIEASFQTLGNPFAQINMVYPILGLGKYYSIGVNSESLQDINKREEQIAKENEAEKQKALQEAKNKQNNTGNSSTQIDTIKTPSGKDMGTRKPKLTGLRLKSLTHTIENGSWKTSYNFGM